MARFNSSLTLKVQTLLDSVVEAAYDDLNSMEACAGIRDSYHSAIAARENHYGHYPPKGGYAPPRVWVDVATRGVDAEARLAKIIKDRVQAASLRSVKKINFTSREGKQMVQTSVTRTRPFGAEHIGAASVLRALASEMANNQRSFVRSGLVSPENKQSTRERKGMNKPPMIWSRKMLKDIRGWVQDGGTGAEIAAAYINKRKEDAEDGDV